MLQRNIAITRLGISQNVMAMAERATATILTRQPYRSAFHQQGAECERFGEAPIDLTIFGDLLNPWCQNPFQSRMD